MTIQNANSVSGGFSSQGGSVLPAASARQPQASDVPTQAAVERSPVSQAPVSHAELKKAVDSANQALSQNNADIEFSVDKDTEQTVVKLVESKSGDVIRQYPTKEAIAIAKAITELQQQIADRQSAGQTGGSEMKGVLVTQQA
jgi:flagellar protein FlaG